MQKLQIGMVVGSLRKDSLNRQLANAIVKLAQEDFSFKFIEIGQLPLYNQDDDDHQTDVVKALKAAIVACDGLIFVSPEYNRSIPGVLKNALDHGSRPPGKNSWGGKPAALIGISPSAVGTAISQQHLRGVLATLDVPTMCQPEMFLQYKEGFFDKNGNFNEGSRDFVKKWVDRFSRWVVTNKS
jgi:chromate reductase